MEIQNISGPDVMASGFSIERPQAEKISADNNSRAVPESAPVDKERGAAVDTYA
jgi:hypothetical protein